HYQVGHEQFPWRRLGLHDEQHLRKVEKLFPIDAAKSEGYSRSILIRGWRTYLEGQIVLLLGSRAHDKESDVGPRSACQHRSVDLETRRIGRCGFYPYGNHYL